MNAMKKVTWKFPLKRTHTGMMFGNGTTGLLVWGSGNQLKITIGRADFWDHRGGLSWSQKQNFNTIRHCLENNDSEGILAIFACDTENTGGQPSRPSIMPVGRLDLMLPEQAELHSGEIDLQTGTGTVFYNLGTARYALYIRLSMQQQLFAIEFPEGQNASVVSQPSWHIIPEAFRRISIEPPMMFDSAGLSGWIQTMPNDPALCVGYRTTGNTIWGLTERGADLTELRRKSERLFDDAVGQGLEQLRRSLETWWKAYWQDIPAIDVPNEKIAFIYYYGLYKFAGFTNPDGIPATLQGPWIEEHRMPPWSSDYHFNINVQMCYWPAYKANRISHLRPMFDMVMSWKEQLRHNAKCFVGIDDGYMLPHAVDDRCTCMGGFWTGTIDHGCSAWIAQMMFQYYRYSGDIDFLRDQAFDFMKGVMRVYEEMLEYRDGQYILPVSVSPEYRGSQMDAWGANASFQLAAIHRLCEDLIAAAAELKEIPEEKWLKIHRELPMASLIRDGAKTRIGLWDGADLEESHRHHSHLGGICPFDIIDWTAPEWLDIVNNTFRHWVEQGMGLWSGWCMPWASMLYSRVGNGMMAEMILETWQKVFTNEGHGTLHDVRFPGFSLIGSAPLCMNADARRNSPDPLKETMQMDAGMGAITAVQDMFLHMRRDILYIFPGIPADWQEAGFAEMPCEGGAMIGGRISGGEIREITVRALRPVVLRIGNPFSDKPCKIVFSAGREICVTDPVITLTLDAGEKAAMIPAVNN